MPSLRVVGGVLVLLAITAVVSPPVAAGLEALGWGHSFSRVYNRVFEILLVVWLIARRRELGLGSPHAIGLRREGWRRDLLAGFAIGAAGLAAALVFCWANNGLVLGLRYPTMGRVVENTAQVHNVIVCTLCSCYPKMLLGIPPAWYKSLAYRSRTVADPRGVLAEFGVKIPADVTVRVHDSTADLRYIVLPMRPRGTSGWSEEKLAAIVTRDCMIGTALPKASAGHGSAI